MLLSTIDSKGQTTVPQPIRDALHTKAGTKLQWNLMPDGMITVRVKSKSILDLAGILKAPKGKKVQIEDMNAWRFI
jgi:AbrB family looped-hinge helix DNA binding protein